ncbi:MAG: flavin reductase family protein [Acidimicrobiales bacterium]
MPAPSDSTPTSIDADRYRRVLGHLPTGVVIISSVAAGAPVGLAIGSFTSLSLDPPLVLFCVDKGSQTWPGIEAGGAFSVNILADDQTALARKFSIRDANRFDGVAWRPAPSGSPIIDGSLAWIDCVLDRVDEAGDHWIAIGRVTALGVDREAAALVFFRGSYGSCR